MRDIQSASCDMFIPTKLCFKRNRDKTIFFSETPSVRGHYRCCVRSQEISKADVF